MTKRQQIEMLKTLVLTSCPPGGLIGDFFAGSGAMGEAARDLERGYVGTEIDPEMCAKAAIRLGLVQQA